MFHWVIETYLVSSKKVKNCFLFTIYGKIFKGNTQLFYVWQALQCAEIVKYICMGFSPHKQGKS